VDWSAILTALLSGIGGSALLIALLALICRKWIGTRIEESIKHEYAKKIEEFKAGLQEKVNKDAADKTLFLKLLETLPSDGSIEFLRTHDHGGPFPKGHLSQLRTFYYEWRNPEHEFLNPELENKSKVLHKCVNEYLTCIGLNAFRLPPPNADYLQVQPEWKLKEDTNEFRELVNKLHTLADKVVKVHEDIVRSGKALLNC
jgi:hypothetical protein